LISHRAQCRTNELQRRSLLGRREIAKLQAIALEPNPNGAVREIGPLRPRVFVERHNDRGLLPAIERREKSLGRSEGLERDIWRRRRALSANDVRNGAGERE